MTGNTNVCGSSKRTEQRIIKKWVLKIKRSRIHYLGLWDKLVCETELPSLNILWDLSVTFI